MIKESGGISAHAQTDVIVPFAYSKVDELMGRLPSVHPSWAMFGAPEGFLTQRRRLFTSRVAPLLGTDEQIDDKIAKINSATDQEEDKPNKETLIKMLQQLLELDRNLTFVMTRRTQYQKG
jgi:hypothetical protein